MSIAIHTAFSKTSCVPIWCVCVRSLNGHSCSELMALHVLWLCRDKTLLK